MPSSADTLTPYEHNLLFNPPYILNITLDCLIDPRRRQSNGQDSKPPRPSNSWILFRTNFASGLQSQDSNCVQHVSKMASKDWKNQPMVVKQYFNALAKLARQWHKEAYPGYTFRPRRQKQNKEKNWSFIEVNKDRFIERNEKKQKGRKIKTGDHLDNSAQLNNGEQTQTLGGCEQHPALGESAPLNESVNLIESEPIDYGHPMLNGYKVTEISDDYEIIPYTYIEEQQQHDSLHIAW
ncbi:5306_t:CDS:1 [Paraglomus brasilianum]|uniref:5306_t:CDS:1 n=1 Tax=Paraglomus brasilianum TaxID=144538 RepID=A0A9N9FES3_9GLOM|nr:5306_t:CDS:1 [Paraglomus brasilianum]